MLIGITGCKGVGKDTAANWLIEGGFQKLPFAQPLKVAIARLFDIEPQHVDDLKDHLAYVQVWHPLSGTPLEMSWRELLQRFGTEVGREYFGENFWVTQWSQAYSDIITLEEIDDPDVVATDVRFANEAGHIKYRGGYIIEITRPGHEPDGHVSEAGIPDDLVDIRVYNDGDLKQFRSQFLAACEAVQKGITNGVR